MTAYRAVALFAVLCFALLALVPLIDWLLATGGIGLAAATARAEQQTGLELTSNLLVVIRLALVEPGLLALLVGSLVPALAAILTLALTGRFDEWKVLAGRLRPAPGVRWQSALGSYVLIVCLLVPALLLVLMLRQATGGAYSGGLTGSLWTLTGLILTAALLDQGAVLEELGWRGFATPELQREIRSPLVVALMVGLLWGLWHVPRDLTLGVVERLGAFAYLVQFLPAFVLGTCSVSVIASYFMNRLGGSVWPAIMVHGLVNDAAGISGSASVITALTPYHQLTNNSVMAVIAILIVVLAGRALGLASKPPD